jgi:hypothetical protein
MIITIYLSLRLFSGMSSADGKDTRMGKAHLYYIITSGIFPLSKVNEAHTKNQTQANIPVRVLCVQHYTVRALL